MRGTLEHEVDPVTGGMHDDLSPAFVRAARSCFLWIINDGGRERPPLAQTISELGRITHIVWGLVAPPLRASHRLRAAGPEHWPSLTHSAPGTLHKLPTEDKSRVAISIRDLGSSQQTKALSLHLSITPPLSLYHNTVTQAGFHRGAQFFFSHL